MSLTPQRCNKHLLRSLSNRHTDHTAWFHADPCRDWCCRKWSSCRAGCCWGNCGSALGHKSRCCGYIHSHRPAPPQKRLQRERQRQQQEQKRLVSRVSYESAEEKHKVAGAFARQIRKRHMHKKGAVSLSLLRKLKVPLGGTTPSDDHPRRRGGTAVGAVSVFQEKTQECLTSWVPRSHAIRLV